jgi:hypothetical protein
VYAQGTIKAIGVAVFASYLPLAVRLVHGLPFWDRFQAGGYMSILAAIRREQKRARKKLAKLQHQLSGLEAAAEALGNSTSRQVNREVKGAGKRVLSAAGRAAIVKAAKKRWAKVRKQAKKVAG